jgi:hypothetical protein
MRQLNTRDYFAIGVIAFIVVVTVIVAIITVMK